MNAKYPIVCHLMPVYSQVSYNARNFNLRLIMKLLVRNLARTTTETEIRDMFAAYGEVSACDLVLNKETGLSKGFAFVEMPDESEANKALSELHETRVAKSKIRVKVAQ